MEGDVPLSLQAHIGIAVNSGAAESAVELLHKAGRMAQAARARGVGFDANPGRPASPRGGAAGPLLRPRIRAASSCEAESSRLCGGTIDSTPRSEDR